MMGEFAPEPDLLALYHLANTSDSSGNNHTLTNYRSTFNSPSGYSRFGNFVIFSDGGLFYDDDYLYHNDTLDINIATQPHSISVWVNLQTQPGSGYYYDIVTWERSTAPGRYDIIRYGYSGGGYVRYRPSKNSDYINVQKTLTLNTWYLIDVTNDITTGKLYLNGDYLASTSVGTDGGSANRIWIGDPSHTWIGRVDETAFWKRARSEEEIKHWYEYCTGRFD